MIRDNECCLSPGLMRSGRIPDEKVAPPLHLGTALDDGHADFFGRPGVDGRFEDDGSARLQVPADRFARRNQGPEVGLVRSSTGVGTATTMKSALPSSLASVVTRSPDEDSNSARLTSPSDHGNRGMPLSSSRRGRSRSSDIFFRTRRPGQAHVPQAYYGNNRHFDSLRRV